MASMPPVEPAELTVRAVAGVAVRDRDGQVLLMRRQTENTWGIPGGGLEPGESWSDAALRECAEETGWVVRIDGLLGIYSDPATQVHRYPSGSQRHFIGVVFRATPLHRPCRGDGEAVELRWVTADSLPESLFSPDAPVLKDALDPDVCTPVIG
jgi:ADP-ribose pyrophosphatase YjhB (NUDIX family)